MVRIGSKKKAVQTGTKDPDEESADMSDSRTAWKFENTMIAKNRLHNRLIVGSCRRYSCFSGFWYNEAEQCRDRLLWLFHQHFAEKNSSAVDGVAPMKGFKLAAVLRCDRHRSEEHQVYERGPSRSNNPSEAGNPYG